MRRMTPAPLVRWLLHPSPRLSHRALHASVWAFASKGLVRGLGYARVIVLARLLAPGDFGLMGVGLIAIAFIEAFTKPGFSEALVQQKGKIDEHLDTLWTVGLYRTFLVSGILVLGAPVVASFFNAPDARWVLQAMGGAVLIRGFSNPGILCYHKDLEFQKKSLNEMGPFLFEVAAAIIAAAILHNVWALVLGFYARNVAQLVISYWSHPYRPRFTRRMHQAKELFAYGRWVYLDRISNFIFTQGDSIILAKLLGPLTLGLYQMAQRNSLAPLMQIPRSASTVAFPVYSKLQSNPAKLRTAFLTTIEATASLSLPLTVTVFLLAQDFVALVLGEKWLPAVAAIQILAITAFLRGLANANGSLFLGTGRPWLNFRLSLVRAIILAAAIYPLTKDFGLSGAAYTALIASSFGLGISFYYSFSVLHLQLAEIVKSLSPAASAGAAVALVVLFSQHAFGTAGAPGFVGTLMLTALTCLGVYVALWWRFNTGLISRLVALRR